MSDDDRVYLQDMIIGWRRNNSWEASQVFLRLFTIINILHVTISAILNGTANFQAAFFNSLIAAVILALLSMVFKTKPMFDK
jgi:tryptophan-rich sensory protein